MTTITPDQQAELDAIRARQAQDAADRMSNDPAVFAAYLRREYRHVTRIITRPGMAWQDIMLAVDMLERVAADDDAANDYPDAIATC